MPDQTPILQLPYILPSQAQKHVTHNEAIRLLDVIVQLSVAARNLPVPPASPVQGDRYIVANGASGDWAGRAGQIALYENGAWQFFAPMAGWTAWITSESVLASYSGSAWTSQADGPFNVGQLGISATPDAVNRLAVSSDATLLNHAGAGHQLKLNKALATATASLLFQTGFSGRAEMGTMGDDDFSIKVSADGTSFVTGLSIASDTGAVTLPVAAILGGQANDPVAPPNGTIWLNSTTGEVKVQSGGAAVVLTAGGAALTDGNKGDISVSAVGTSWQINAGAVGNTQMAVMASGSFKARASAGTGAPEDITPTAAAALLPVFDAASKGLVPASGGGSTAFLRADGTWAAPAGGGGGIGTLADLGVTATAAELNAMDGVTAAGTALLQAADPAAQLAALGIGKVILNIAKLETGSSFTRNASTDVVFGPTLTYTPVRSDSRFLIMASFSAQIAQSGGDNDARGKIKLIVQHGAGLYTSGNVLPENNDNIGGINYGADPSSNAQMSIIADTNVRNNAGNLVLRYWGSVSADGTAGYAALLTVYGSPTILVMEYI